MKQAYHIDIDEPDYEEQERYQEHLDKKTEKDIDRRLEQDNIAEELFCINK